MRPPVTYHVGVPSSAYMKPAAYSASPWNSSAKPRPDSRSYHHQPLSGAPAGGASTRPFEDGKRTSGVVPPGHASVTLPGAPKSTRRLPGDVVATGGTYGPASVCPFA